MSLHLHRSVHHLQHRHAGPNKAPDEIRRECEEDDVEPYRVVPANGRLNRQSIAPVWLHHALVGRAYGTRYNEILAMGGQHTRRVMKMA